MKFQTSFLTPFSNEQKVQAKKINESKKCPECNSNTLTNPIIHLFKHPDWKKAFYACKVCKVGKGDEKIFVSKNGYNRHVRQHISPNLRDKINFDQLYENEWSPDIGKTWRAFVLE